MWKKLGTALTFIVILIAGAIGSQIGRAVGDVATSPAKPTQEEKDKALFDGLAQAAEKINANGATMVDADTRMDRAEAGPGPRLTYFYTFPKYSSGQISSDLILNDLGPEVRKKVCTNNDMKPSLQYGATYIYVYGGNDGQEIARFEVSRSDCSF